MLILLHAVYAYFPTKLTGFDRDHVAHKSLKYLPSGPLEEKFAYTYLNSLQTICQDAFPGKAPSPIRASQSCCEDHTKHTQGT